MPTTPSLTAAAGRAVSLLRRFASVDPANVTASAEDLAALHRASHEALVRNTRLLALGGGLANLVYWPSDLYNLRGQPEVIRILGHGRVALTVTLLLLWLALTFLPLLRRHAGATLGVFGTATCFILANCFARLSGPSGPWFHFTYLLMLMPLVAWLNVAQRVAATGMFGLAVVVGYFSHDPDYLHDPLALVAVSHLFFAVMLSIGSGAVLDVLRHETYLMRLVMARQAEELKGLNGQLESRVREQTAELRFLANRLERAREAERTAIARDLHDELGQELTALRYALEAASTRFERDPMGVRNNLAQLEKLVARTTSTARSILVDLRPRALDELGLSAAVEWLVERTRARVPCTLDAPEEELAVSDEVAVAAFRIVQESLTNVARHASATEAGVTVRTAGDRLELEVRDNGRGFETAAPPRGMGLLGMRERVRALGGELILESVPGRGTTVHVTLPRLAKSEEAA